MNKIFKIAGLGEVLWDVYENEKTFGGAPGNVACHCHSLGAESYVISCVGNDDLGREASEFLKKHGVSISALALSDEHETGSVLVTLDDKGKPEYEIKKGVAWDYIPFTPAMNQIASRLDAVCFGTLAQRNNVSRNSIEKFLDDTRPDCLKMFDINIRLNFYNDEIILSSLKHANALKINDEELPLLAKLLDISGTEEEQLIAISEKYCLRIAILTCGSKGALMVRGKEVNFAPCIDVGPLVSTVGAGDSFTATAIMGYLNNKPLAEINEHANLVASYVCTQKGAVPKLPKELI